MSFIEFVQPYCVVLRDLKRGKRQHSRQNFRTRPRAYNYSSNRSRSTVVFNLKFPIYAHGASERLSAKLKCPVNLGTPTFFQDVCERMDDLVLELDLEVSDWKDHFFFDALEAHENDLCHECKESMRVTFYVINDRSQALKWKPHRDCCYHRRCKYYKIKIFEDLYEGSDLREVPMEYEGYSD